MRQDFWSQPRSWPIDLPGHIFAARALLLLGQHRYPELWQDADPASEWFDELPQTLNIYTSNRDLQRASRLLNIHCPEYSRSPGARILDGSSSAIPTPEQWVLARKHAAAEVEECKSKFDRVYSVIFEFCAAGREGSLRTSLRARDGGELQPVDSSFWYLERGHRRFDNCRVDPQNPYIVPKGDRETKWIYFDRSDIEDLLAPPTTEDHSCQATETIGGTATTPRRGPGRPPRYPWDEFEAEVARRRQMGDIPSQPMEYISAALVEEMLEWCQNHWDQEPARSTIQAKLSELLKNSVD